MVTATTTLAFLIVLGGEQLKDQVLLKDGRLLEGKLENRNEGLYLVLTNGTVRIPDDAVQETCLVNLDSYVPKDDFEKEQLKKGLVLHKGTWITKARYEGMLRQRVEQRRKRIEEMRSLQDWSKAVGKKTAHFEFKSNCPADVLETYMNHLERYYDHFVKAWRYVGLQSLYRKLAGKEEEANRLKALAKELDPEFDDTGIEFRLAGSK
ncbi:MAG: hypothetical protein U1E76_12315 [Planctomycetota bacterium]